MRARLAAHAGALASSLLCALLLAACAHSDVRLADPAGPAGEDAEHAASAPAPEVSAGGGCRHGLQLEGLLSVPGCPKGAADCKYGRDAVNAYAERIRGPEHALTVMVASSPWRFYDGEGRIVAVSSLAERIRSSLTPGKREVVLYAGWTSVSPEPGLRSLAQQLSDALDGVPVRGFDGFLWIEPDGRLRTTQQAFTAWHTGGGYRVAPDQPVLTSLAFGEMMFYAERLREGQNHGLLLHAAVGWDVHMLCPDRALAEFELLAPHHPIAAYNAALMRLESGKADDHATALRWLQMAEAAGDEPARELLSGLLLR